MPVGAETLTTINNNSKDVRFFNFLPLPLMAIEGLEQSQSTASIRKYLHVFIHFAFHYIQANYILGKTSGELWTSVESNGLRYTINTTRSICYV
jgi:hypothetical protein